MNEAEVITFVDENPDATVFEIKKFIAEQIAFNPFNYPLGEKLEIIGLSRLAGSYQIQGRDEDHKRIIDMLRLEYGLWTERGEICDSERKRLDLE